MVLESDVNSNLSDHTKIGSVTLKVNDLDRCRSFYEGMLGLEARSLSDDLVELSAPSGQVFVRLKSDPSAAPRPRGTTGLYHFAILMTARQSLAVVLDRLLSNGYPLEGAADHYVSEAVYLADPEGNGIEVYADRPREEWFTPTGEMRMGTVALDVEDLLSTLHAENMEGRTPPGTRIGHIHLRVADLEAAIRFYRDILGFDLMMRYGPSAGFLSAGGYHHHIGINTWAGVNAPPAPTGSRGLDYFTIETPRSGDLERIVENAEASNVGMQKDGDVLHISDPAENRMIIKINATNGS